MRGARREAGIGLVMALLLAAQAAVAEGDRATVRGVLFDAETARPVAGVEIYADGERVGRTNDDGAFEVSLEAGARVLALEKDGESWPPLEPLALESGQSWELIMDLGPPGEPVSVSAEGGKTDTAAKAVSEDAVFSTIEGTVINEEEGGGVEGARIFARGVPGEARTGPDGSFVLEVPVGTYDLFAVHPEFSTMSRPGVVVEAGVAAQIELEAVPMGMQLDDLVVSVPKLEGGTAALMQERQEAATVNDVIGAEQMSKAGDSDAAGALKRVTGVTVVGGKYIYVRGLGERYSCTLLNGATLPSPEPERRVVPLDLFPTGILDSVVIQKTYSPDMPAEFGGGAVMLRTRSHPEELTLDVKLSAGATVGTTFTNGLMSQGGPTDWLGIDGGYRALPTEVEEASKDHYLLEGDMLNPGYSADELEHFGEAMRNNWRTYRDTIPPDLSGSVTVGDMFEIGQAKLGFLAAIVYANEWERDRTRIQILSGGAEGQGATVFHRYRWDETTNEIKSAGILNLGLEITENHRIQSTTLLNRITDNSARNYWGYNRDLGNDIRVWRIRWVERTLLTQQIKGTHVILPLMDLEIDWRYTFSRAIRDEPDRKDVAYNREGETTDLWLLSDRPEGNLRLFSEMLEDAHDMGMSIALPFEQWTDEEAKVKIGGNVTLKEREVDTRRYKYKFRSPDSAISSLPPHQLFTPEYIGMVDQYGVHNKFEEVTRPTDNYGAEHEIFAGYAMTEFPLGLGLSLMGGLRVEHSRQFVRTFDLFGDEDSEPVDATIDTLDYLPAATLSWEFIEDMVVRVGFSQTVSRPDFREMSPASFTNVIGGRDVEGNPELERTLITNLDLRWEWYFSPGESVSFGGFYKHFESPIERIVILRAQLAESYDNAKAARNLGLELDFRKNFGFFAEALEDLYVAGNATWVYSRIVLGEEGIQTNSKRPLQGQSPFVVNAVIGYDNVDSGTNVALLYNVFGERISTVGAQGGQGTEGLPDVYEMPFHQLDFVFAQKLGAGFKLGFKAKNLIDLPYKYKQGGTVTEVGSKGRSFSLSLSYSY